MQINTVAEYRKTVKAAKDLFIQPRFGVSESWIKISKKDALWLVDAYEPSSTAQHAQMFGESFGHFEDGTFWIG